MMPCLTLHRNAKTQPTPLTQTATLRTAQQRFDIRPQSFSRSGRTTRARIPPGTGANWVGGARTRSRSTAVDATAASTGPAAVTRLLTMQEWVSCRYTTTLYEWVPSWYTATLRRHVDSRRATVLIAVVVGMTPAGEFPEGILRLLIVVLRPFSVIQERVSSRYTTTLQEWVPCRYTASLTQLGGMLAKSYQHPVHQGQ